ncbi:MFS transporter [Alicyclobacillus shizuokensis]|uniref:MFS transporter n=1 Tax=Alicyclobacillus shizuokensis TaxID=392014 RepID=UPI0008300907|nr:MFS transporter [Alicyclobacillus shizuokensis]
MTSSARLGPSSRAGIPERMERLPMTRFTGMVVLLSGLAWFIESLSIGSLGVALDPLKQVMHLSAGQVGVLTAASTFGIVLGLIPAGFLADKFGRKQMLVWGILEYSLFTLLCAFSPNYGVLLLFRFLSGFGMGAVFPLPYAIVSEFVPSTRRAWFNGLLDACLSVGYFIAPLLGLVILPRFDLAMSWRVFFAVSALPMLYAYVIHRMLPESPRWLERKGRLQEAEALMRSIEERVERLTGQPLPAPVAAGVGEDAEAEAISAQGSGANPGPGGRLSAGILAPWRPPYVRRTVARAASAIGTFYMFYIVMTYMPTLFVSQGLSFAHSLEFTAIITAAAIPGKLLNGWMAEWLGRKWVYVLFMGVAGVASLFFGLARSAVGMVTFACVMSLFGTGAFPALKMSYAEQYPTHLRTTGAATVETLGRFFGGVVGSYAMPVILQSAGMAVGFYIVAAVALCAVVIELVLAPETKALTLEQLEARLAH